MATTLFYEAKEDFAKIVEILKKGDRKRSCNDENTEKESWNEKNQFAVRTE